MKSEQRIYKERYNGYGIQFKPINSNYVEVWVKVKKSKRYVLVFFAEYNATSDIKDKKVEHTIHHIGNKYADEILKDLDLVDYLKGWLEKYFMIADFHMPRIYINIARTLADMKHYNKLLDIKNESNAELINNAAISLISSVAILSYAGIESFANHCLIKILGQTEFIEYDNQRTNLKDKLKKLCNLMNYDSCISSNNKIWSDFLILEEIRDSFVHYKRDNVFYLINRYNDSINPGYFLNTAIRTILFYFDKSNLAPNDYLIGNLFLFENIKIV